MKITILIALAVAIFFVGYRCNRKDSVALYHQVPVPSLNHYEISGSIIMRAPLPPTTKLESSTDGTNFTDVPWGNETFGDKTFGCYELRLKSSSLWLRVTGTNTAARFVFIANE
ncbi:MAG: hypothetical protein NTY53_15720 [Kiritimatiellaeota bacterium]|nr:hypothetical protein [Kiritimatiellota bacterium]